MVITCETPLKISAGQWNTPVNFGLALPSSDCQFSADVNNLQPEVSEQTSTEFLEEKGEIQRFATSALDCFRCGEATCRMAFLPLPKFTTALLCAGSDATRRTLNQ